MADLRLRLITGWALLTGATGILFDSFSVWILDSFNRPEWLVTIVTPTGVDNGSIGLIPAYLGVTVGMIGFIIVMYRSLGIWLALLTGAGVAGMFAFWYSYPDRATFGGVGSILIGIAVLSLPNWGRFASPIWVASGIMGIPELVRPGINWGPIASFSLLGAAIAVTGVFVVWGNVDHNTQRAQSPPASVRAAR